MTVFFFSCLLLLLDMVFGHHLCCYFQLSCTTFFPDSRRLSVGKLWWMSWWWFFSTALDAKWSRLIRGERNGMTKQQTDDLDGDVYCCWMHLMWCEDESEKNEGIRRRMAEANGLMANPNRFWSPTGLRMKMKRLKTYSCKAYVYVVSGEWCLWHGMARDGNHHHDHDGRKPPSGNLNSESSRQHSRAKWFKDTLQWIYVWHTWDDRKADCQTWMAIDSFGYETRQRCRCYCSCWWTTTTKGTLSEGCFHYWRSDRDRIQIALWSTWPLDMAVRMIFMQFTVPLNFNCVPDDDRRFLFHGWTLDGCRVMVSSNRKWRNESRLDLRRLPADYAKKGGISLSSWPFLILKTCRHHHDHHDGKPRKNGNEDNPSPESGWVNPAVGRRESGIAGGARRSWIPPFFSADSDIQTPTDRLHADPESHEWTLDSFLYGRQLFGDSLILDRLKL